MTSLFHNTRSKKKKKWQRSRYHPSFWYWWAVLGVLRLLCALPYRLQLAVGRAVGRGFYRFGKRRRHIAEVNLELCFPKMSKGERQTLLCRHFAALGMGLMEVGMCWWATDSRLESLCDIQGLEHIERARADGRGVLLLCSHTTCHELTTRVLCNHVPLHVIYKPFKNPVLKAVSEARRSKHGTIIPRRYLLSAVRHLKSGGMLWYAFDQSENKGEAGGLMVPFFGEPKLVHTGAARIAQLSAAVVLPLYTQRLAGSAGYRLSIGAPLENFPSDDSVADAATVMALVEEQVRMAPEQYSWAHPRFARRPLPLTDPY